MIAWLRNPWGRPRFLALGTGAYIIWSIVPVAIAILFAFNAGRSRTTWQGFSLRWFTGPTGSGFPRPPRHCEKQALRLFQSLRRMAYLPVLR